MRHRRAGKHLGRTASHRKALWRNMAASLFQYGAIRTTEVKAKQLRRFAEKLITFAKKGDLHARRRVIQLLQDRAIYTLNSETGEHEKEEGTSIVKKLFDEIAPRYAKRDGGYTRIIRVAERRIGDGGVQVILQLVEEDVAGGKGGSSRRKARAEKRFEALKAAGVLGGKAEAPAAVEEAVEEAPAAEETAEEVAEAPAEESVEEASAEAPAEEEGEEKAE